MILDSSSIRTRGWESQGYRFPTGIATNYEDGKTIEADTIWPGIATFSKISFFKHSVRPPKENCLIWFEFQFEESH